MSAFARRRIIMDNFISTDISIEKFAAYLDGNLSASDYAKIDAIVSHHPELEDLSKMADIIDEDIHDYLNDEFIFEADMDMLENTRIEIPTIDYQEDGMLSDDDNQSEIAKLSHEDEFGTNESLHEEDSDVDPSNSSVYEICENIVSDYEEGLDATQDVGHTFDNEDDVNNENFL